MNVTDYLTESEWKKVIHFSEKLETPCVVINLDRIKKNYLELKNFFSTADIYYAVKANPHEEVLKLLIELGANFDIASRYELDKILYHYDSCFDLVATITIFFYLSYLKIEKIGYTISYSFVDR